jgi:hypothetical protein
MQQKMPWDEDWSQPQATGQSGYPTITTRRDPRQVARDDASLRRTNQQIAMDDATASYDTRRKAADATTAEANAKIAQTKAAEAGVGARAIDPKLDRLTGASYISQLPAETQAQVQALADGRMAFPSGSALRSPYWQEMLQHVAHFDPQFDAVNYNARAATRRDFVAGKSAQNIRALNTAIGHLGQLSSQAAGTASHSFTPYNAVSNFTAETFGSAGPGVYSQTAGALASELTQVFRGAGGAEADIKRELEHLTPNASMEQKQAAVRNVAGLLKSRLDALGDQYSQGIGTTAKPLQLLNPHARDAYAVLSKLGVSDDDGSSPGSGSLPGGGGGAPTLATGAMKSESDPALKGVNGRVASMLRSGASDASIRDFIAKSGAPADPSSVSAVLAFRQKNPSYKGDYSVQLENRDVPTTGWNQFASSPVGTGLYAAVDAGLGGTTDEIASALGGGDLADLNARKQAAFAANPKSALLGQVAGTIGGMATLGAVGRGTGLAAKFAAPQLAGDIAFGAASGAGQSNDNRLLGGTLGAAGGLGGNLLGQGAASAVGAVARTKAAMATMNRVRGMFGSGAIPRVQPISGADRTLLGAVDQAGFPNVQGQLTEAQGMGMPMSLADTNPNLRELAGAAVRRSPTAATYAEDALIPRSRGQYDRFTSSVESNLGPTTNIPQRSADMMAQARNGASDLYDKAYGNPVPSTPELDSVLGTPFGRQALGRARTIAANERRSPDELGFAQDADGNVALNPRPNDAIAQHLGARAELDAAQDAYRAARQSPTEDVGRARDRLMAARDGLRRTEQALNAAPDPQSAASVPAYTTQTLDYVKRGMDDVLEEKRSPITGKLVLDEAGRAQNGVRGQLLNEVDRLNPDFAQARSAYAGPMASRDALARGGDAYGLPSDELGMQVANQTPEHLGQMQLGYRGALVDHASKVRDSGNPWEATLGAPASRDRLETMYPNNPGVARMLRQRDLEGRMQQTKDGVIGNSKTAGRQIMDKVFDGGGWPVALGEAGLAVLTHGATLPLALRRFAGENARDAIKLGIGSRAVGKADELAPKLLNPDPAAALATARELLAQQQAWRELVATTKPKGLGMFGRGFGSQAAVIPMNR